MRQKQTRQATRQAPQAPRQASTNTRPHKFGRSLALTAAQDPPNSTTASSPRSTRPHSQPPHHARQASLT
eukprot:scaffold5797_cov115-Isochrysis_galbana.AAC.6